MQGLTLNTPHHCYYLQISRKYSECGLLLLRRVAATHRKWSQANIWGCKQHIGLQATYRAASNIQGCAYIQGC